MPVHIYFREEKEDDREQFYVQGYWEERKET
jgi:hypothetical protein